MNILVVDDKPSLVRVTSLALQTLGHKAFTAGTTAAATAIINRETIHAILLDVNLNGEDGLSYLSELAKNSRRAPVILFTAQTRDEVSADARREGVFGCLLKPFSMDELRRQLARLDDYYLRRKPAPAVAGGSPPPERRIGETPVGDGPKASD